MTTTAAPTATRPASLWDRFFFEPQSTAPMTLVRIAWGAVMVLWSLSLLPDVDPFLTTGALRYDRSPAVGLVGPARRHPARQRAAGRVPAAARGVGGDDDRLPDAPQHAPWQ